VPFLSGEAEEPLLEDGVRPVPQRDGEDQRLVAIGDSGDAVLVPAVRAAARMVVRKIVPGGPAGAVVLAHRPPGTLTQVRPPALPVLLSPTGFLESALLGAGGRGTELRHRGAHGDSSCRTWPSGSRTRSGRGVEDGAGAPGRVTKVAWAPWRPATSAGPSRESILTGQWKTALPRSAAG